MRSAGLDEEHAGIKIAGRSINSLRYAVDNHSNGGKWRGTKEPLDEGKRGEWKAGLKLSIVKKEDHDIQFHYFMANRWGKVKTVTDFLFLGSKITADGDCSHEIKRCLLLGKKAMTNLDRVLKSKWHHFADKIPCSQSYGFSSSHVWMWELGHKEGWALKNWCFRIVVLEKMLESPLDSKEIKPVTSKGNQPWIFTERTEAEALVHWPPDAKSQLFGFPTLILGKMEGKRRREQQRMRGLDSFTDSMDVTLSKLWETVENNSNVT